jgi:hypothetical protein
MGMYQDLISQIRRNSEHVWHLGDSEVMGVASFLREMCAKIFSGTAYPFVRRPPKTTFDILVKRSSVEDDFASRQLEFSVCERG